MSDTSHAEMIVSYERQEAEQKRWNDHFARRSPKVAPVQPRKIWFNDKFYWTGAEYRRGLRCGKSRIRSAWDALRQAFEPLPF